MFKSRLVRWCLYPILSLVLLAASGIGLVALVLIYSYPRLPPLTALTDYQPDILLRVYSADGVLIGEYGEERREPLLARDLPATMRQAILAAEDERFFEHKGIDLRSLSRAVLADLQARSRAEGASTITMQVARNFYLTREKTFTRKFREILLALKIDRELSKEQILLLYANHIFLGQHAYGFAAAAKIYFGKDLDQLNLAEMAMLAGLPKSPSTDNPIVSPGRARGRQLYVLSRLRDMGTITPAQYQAARDTPIEVTLHLQPAGLHADFVAELIRQDMVARFGEDAYHRGFRVYTTIRGRDQEAAFTALRQGVFEYDRRHGYRGPEGTLDLPDDEHAAMSVVAKALGRLVSSDELLPAAVLSVDKQTVSAMLADGREVMLEADGLAFGGRKLGKRPASALGLARGSVIRVRQDEDGHWRLTQWPAAEAALVSLDPHDGAVRSLIGGFDFQHSQFNHVTQAYRQPGSSFKPFVYSAALEKGFTPGTIVNDAPLVIDGIGTDGKAWAPQNYDHDYAGPITVRRALMQSRNLVAIRVLQAIGVKYAHDYVGRFGLDPARQPPYLSMVLGSGSVTPLELASAYAVFANGGYRVQPHLIDHIDDRAGRTLYRVHPALAGQDAPRAIDARNAFVMNSLMQDVVRRGTAAAASKLGRKDLAGKTGTTEAHVDTWFAGYQPGLVAVSWLGFDQVHSLGGGETGAKAALPIWMAYMGEVLKGVPEVEIPMPEGLIASREGDATDYYYRELGPSSRSLLADAGGGEAAPQVLGKDAVEALY